MAFDIDLIVEGTTYNLNDAVDFKVVEEDGIGLPPSHLITHRGPLQHGDTFQDFRLDPRFIQLVFWQLSSSETDHFDLRTTIMDALKLSTSPVILKYTLDDGSVRQIDCFYDSGLSFPSIDRAGAWYQKNGVSLYCPDPLFYDPTARDITFAIDGGSDTFPVPMAVPHKVGTSTLNSNKIVVNDGTWETFPHLIRITGPITNPKITNWSFSPIEKLDFSGTTISAGNYYDIDLRYGYKTVVNNSGTNKIEDLSNDSDLVSWSLGADPQVPNGQNSITVTGSNATLATKVDISWINHFIGLGG